LLVVHDCQSFGIMAIFLLEGGNPRFYQAVEIIPPGCLGQGKVSKTAIACLFNMVKFLCYGLDRYLLILPKLHQFRGRVVGKPR
jgi:hypothetical protein